MTGTNGKSTTAALIAEALATTGSRPPLAGNTEFGVPMSAVTRTTRSPIVAEVSSFQLEGSPCFLPEVAVLTNITGDHLWRHRTISVYAALKRRMFVRGDAATPLAILNLDDPNGRALAREVRDRGGATITFGRATESDYRIADERWTIDHGHLTMYTPDGAVPLTTRQPGPHNASNVVAAFAAADALGVPRDDTVAAFEQAPRVPGRLEPVDEGQPFHALVDFAHTYDGVAKTLATVRAAIDGRLVTVLSVMGTGEDPLKWEIGRVARAQSDVLIITTATVRGEPRLLTLQRLYGGAKQVPGGPLIVEPDRRRAIARALEFASPGDAVVVLGRGAHRRIVIDRSGASFPFDDRQVIRELLRHSPRMHASERA